MRAWYRSRWRTTKLGTILATVHLSLLTLLIGGIAISPSRDWYWWPLFPFFLDWPFSILIKWLSEWTRDLSIALPHATLERWLLSEREPFSSFDLFWVPAVLFTVLGTLWHYYWPQMPGIIRRAFRSKQSPPPVA